MTFGERVKARRIELGWTQEELAEKMGYKSKSSINKIELGINDVTQSKITKFAEVMHTSVEYLMGWDEDVQTNGQEPEYYLDEEAREMLRFLNENPKHKKILSSSRKLKPEDLEIIEAMIERMS